MCLKVPASDWARGVAGMLNYVKKFAMEILPSVAATIIGAYIVNHYIVDQARPRTPLSPPPHRLPTAQYQSCRPRQGGQRQGADVRPADRRRRQPPGGRRQGEGHLREGHHGEDRRRKADGGREAARQSLTRNPLTRNRPTRRLRPRASRPSQRRHTPAPREKVRVVLPSPVQPVTPACAGRAVPVPAPPVRPRCVPEERRDANDLARAAIERLRGTGDSSPRPQEAARTPEAPRAPEASALPKLPGRDRAGATPAAAADHGFDAAQTSRSIRLRRRRGRLTRPVRECDPRRPTPPADIPAHPPARPARRGEPSRRRGSIRRVAEDVLSAAKSMFHAVLPK